MVSSGSSRHAAFFSALRWVAVSSLAACCVTVKALFPPRRPFADAHRGSPKTARRIFVARRLIGKRNARCG